MYQSDGGIAAALSPESPGAPQSVDAAARGNRPGHDRTGGDTRTGAGSANASESSVSSV